MSFVNSGLLSLKRLGRRIGIGDAVSDSETQRILSKKSGTSSDSSNEYQNQNNESQQRATFDVLPAGSVRRKPVSHPNEEQYNENNAFFNKAFQLSPSDLERSWKSRRPSMNCNDVLRRTKSECKISIDRYPVDSSYINKKYEHLPAETFYKKAGKYVKSRCACNFSCFLLFFTNLFPVLSWLPKYRREYIIQDIAAGITISILHIPQGMAYGVLASVKPENGLYVSFFPVLIYFLMGTSRHISIGTFAVISLMLSTAIYSTDSFSTRDLNSTSQNVSNASLQIMGDYPPTHLEIATSLAMAVGLWQIFMGVFSLGSLTVVLSDQLISGFSTGAACHVAVSQMKDLFGIHTGRYSGPLELVYTLQDIFENLVNTNGATVLASAIAIFLLAIFKEQIDRRLKGRLKIPIPIDLIVVVLATTASYFGKFHLNYNVKIIGDIPTGLPSPVTPRFDLFSALIGNSIAIAIVAYTISLSMAKLLSQQYKYTVRPNQELLALGCANIFSSFFACYPCSASMSRSLVQERAGGKTQVAGVISCCILLVVLLVLAPLFYHLPKCILSCIILVALKPMFLQIKDFVKSWGVSKIDALIWLVTFLSTILMDMTYGLLVGVLFSLMTVIFRTVIPSKTFLGRIPETDIYLDLKRYNRAGEIEGIKIFHFESALYFINREMFKSYLFKHVPLKNEIVPTNELKSTYHKIHRIIIDCSTFTFVDLSGLETLIEVMKEYQDIGISVFLSGCSISMQEVMERAKFSERLPQHPSIFPTIHDAVEFHYLPHTTTSDT